MAGWRTAGPHGVGTELPTRRFGDGYDNDGVGWLCLSGERSCGDAPVRG